MQKMINFWQKDDKLFKWNFRWNMKIIFCLYFDKSKESGINI